MPAPDLYSTTVPLPSRSLQIPDGATTAEAGAQLDAFFDDLIRAYPPETQGVLRMMYHDNENIWSVDTSRDQTLQQGFEANWQLRGDGAGCVVFDMLVDARLCETDILLRCAKIHEIAGHIGQAHERLLNAGYDQFMDDLRRGPLQLFLEQSIAPAEKMLIDALPEPLVAADLARIEDADMREAAGNTLRKGKARSYDDYIRLHHRPEGQELPEAAHAALHTRPDLAAFGRLMTGADGGEKLPPEPRRNDIHFR